jgi:hypothetical protein
MLFKKTKQTNLRKLQFSFQFQFKTRSFRENHTIWRLFHQSHLKRSFSVWEACLSICLSIYVCVYLSVSINLAKKLQFCTKGARHKFFSCQSRKNLKVFKKKKIFRIQKFWARTRYLLCEYNLWMMTLAQCAKFPHSSPLVCTTIHFVSFHSKSNYL